MKSGCLVLESVGLGCLCWWFGAYGWSWGWVLAVVFGNYAVGSTLNWFMPVPKDGDRSDD